MSRVLPPPEERFDPITARWLVPGGPIHDPQRDSVDPRHDEHLTLVEPVPPELAAADDPGDAGTAPTRRWRRRWLLIGLVGLFLAAMLVSGALTI
jgi:hypothetical protein